MVVPIMRRRWPDRVLLILRRATFRIQTRSQHAHFSNQVCLIVTRLQIRQQQHQRRRGARSGRASPQKILLISALFVLVPPRSYAPRAVRIWESDRKCVCLPRAGGYERGGSARPVVVGNSPASTSLPRCSPARSPPHRCSLLPGPLQSVEQNVCPPPCRCPRCLGGTRL